MPGLDPGINTDCQRSLNFIMDHQVTPLGRFATCTAAG
jgi:hypothetical protein